MKINSINNVNTDVIKKQSAVKQTTGQNEIKQINSLTMAYPQNYYVSFAGGRNTQKAYDDFKDTEMPTTVRNFIENEELLSSPEDIKVLKDNGLKYIHRLAYSSLPDCKTIDDIKKAYPHDKAFKNLKSVREIENTTFGPIMKELDEKGKKIIDCEEDVPTFLAKKIFFEGKMYQDVAQDFIDALTPEAKEAGLQNALPTVKAMGTSEFFANFGLKTPNGVTYGSALQYSDPNSPRYKRKYLIDMDSKQVNEKIQSFLRNDNTKPRYAMMDAWNKCENIRKDLSVFFSDNINNPLLLTTSGDDSSFDFYDNVFYSKMGKLMTAFWNKYPEHKETIGVEIKKSLEEYDIKHAIGGEQYAEYLKNIETKSREIRENIHIDKTDFYKQFPNVIENLSIIASKANPMVFKTPTADNDFAQLFSKCFSHSEYVILNGDDTTEEYKKIYPDGIKAKLVQLIGTPEYSNLQSSQNLAFVQAALNDKQMNTDEVDVLKTTDKIDKFELIKTVKEYLQKNPSYDNNVEMEKIYNDYKKPLSTSERAAVKKELTKHFDFENSEDKFHFNHMLSTQGKYLLNVLDKGPMKDITQVQFWKEFDRIYGTKYSNDILPKVQMDNVFVTTKDVISNIDFSQYHKNSW